MRGRDRPPLEQPADVVGKRLPERLRRKAELPRGQGAVHRATLEEPVHAEGADRGDGAARPARERRSGVRWPERPSPDGTDAKTGAGATSVADR